MQIIIPMSGIGKRFADAGYEDIKPLITINGKTIIEYVISLFDPNDQFYFIVNENHLKNTNVASVIIKKIPKAIIIPIQEHKLGPVYAVQQAYHYINNDQPCIVNYCDFFMLWDYQNFRQYIQQTNCDGCIPCYTGFHPHLLVQENVYAGCKIDDHHRLISIKEKFSFTQNKMEGYHSVGTYYFKSGTLLKKYFDLLIASNHHLHGEFYVSMVYEKMIADGLTTQVYNAISHFCQWGTPRDLEEFNWWNRVIENEKEIIPIKNQIEATIVMPMAGKGQRFIDAGYQVLKPFILVEEQPMFLKVLNYLPKTNQNIFITKQKIAASYLSETDRQILIEQTTEGQACTALLAMDKLDSQYPLLITPSDNGMLYNIDELVELMQLADVIIFTFKNAQAVVDKPEAYGWVEEMNGNAIRISCKKAISNEPKNDHAITGAFWFKKASYFSKAAQNMIDENRRIHNEFYIDECMNDCIALGLTVKVFEIAYYIGWGTPNDLKTYLYWKSYFDVQQ